MKNPNERTTNQGHAGRSKAAARVTTIGLVANAVLVLVKYAAGILGESGAMIADATHSLSDMITDVAVLFGFHYIDKPADSSHEYGHGKIETLSAAFCGGALFLAAVGIVLPACLEIYETIVRKAVLTPPGWTALSAAILSVAVKETLYRYTALFGKKLNSPALIANAWHHRSDALSSIGTGLGIGGAILGGTSFAVLDPIAALIVGLFVLKTAWEITLASLNELIEASIGEDGERVIRDIIVSQNGVLGFHAVKSRRIGYYIAIEAHILVDAGLGIVQAHDISTHLERRLKKEFGPATHVTIHVEPNDRRKDRKDWEV